VNLDEEWAGTGLSLAQAYWTHVVAPVLDQHCPEVARSAARVGTGSEVIGLDDLTSQDHDWGLRLQVFVGREDLARVRTLLDEHLPEEYAGFPTRMAFTGQAEARVAVDVLTLSDFAHDRLGFDPRRSPSIHDWLSVSGQAALEVTAGSVYEDQDGSLRAMRHALAWYPGDIWRYVVASGWHRLDQELPLVGRAGDRGDDLGSRVIAARLVDVATHLAFTIGRRWTPYSKWRGTLLGALPLTSEFSTGLRQVLAADGWQERSQALDAALTQLSLLQRGAGLPAVDRPCVPFWDRPYLRIDQSLVPAITESIDDPSVRALPVGLGSIDQRTDNIDVLVQPGRRRAAVRLIS
jgi:hypothetical protein